MFRTEEPGLGTQERQAPPHLYALLRIAFGVIGLIHLAAMSDIAAYWAPDGILPTGSHAALSA